MNILGNSEIRIVRKLVLYGYKDIMFLYNFVSSTFSGKIYWIVTIQYFILHHPLY